MGLTKQQLEELNNFSFPNNTAGLITPEVLRFYNDSVIVNTVNEDIYNTDSASFNSKIAAISASSVTSAITASSLVTASVSGQTMTFTKGNGTTFNVTLPAGGSGSVINTGSFATTGSNSFTGSQSINGNINFVNSGNITANSGSPLTISNSNGFGLQLNLSSSVARVLQIQNIGGTITVSGSSTTIQGVDFIPFSSSVNSRLNSITGSTPAGTVSSSAQITAFGFATTGSNTFVGDQTINNGFALTLATLKSSTSAGLIISSSAGLAIGRLGAGGGQQAEFFGQLTALGAISSSTITGLGNATLFSSSVNSRINAITGSGGTINTGSFITTGSIGTTSQTVLGDFNFNTSYTGSTPVVNQAAGGTNELGIDYGAFNDLINYWGGLNFEGVLVNGTGVTNASITSYAFDAYFQAFLSSGTTTNGATYTLTGPAIQDISITGSLQVTSEVRARDTATGQRAVMDVRGFYSQAGDQSIQAGASTDGGVYTFASNGNIISLAASSSQVQNQSGPTPYDVPQIAVEQNGQGKFTQIGFQGNNNYTNGTITIYQPLALMPMGAPSSPNSGSLYFSNVDGHFYGWNGVQWKQLDN